MARVVWSDEARQDLDAVFLRLNAESVSYSKKWIDEVFKKVDLVQKFPSLGRRVPEIGINAIREIFAGRYRIIYRISAKSEVEIITIRHSGKPLSEL